MATPQEELADALVGHTILDASMSPGGFEVYLLLSNGRQFVLSVDGTNYIYTWEETRYPPPIPYSSRGVRLYVDTSEK